jgi:hypothetical protein
MLLLLAGNDRAYNRAQRSSDGERLMRFKVHENLPTEMADGIPRCGLDAARYASRVPMCGLANTLPRESASDRGEFRSIGGESAIVGRESPNVPRESASVPRELARLPRESAPWRETLRP